MPQSKRPRRSKQLSPKPAAAPNKRIVESLFDAIVADREYASIVDCHMEGDLVSEVLKALNAISNVRGNPCIAYLGNVVTRSKPHIGVDSSDDLPFAEMVSSVPAEIKKIDILLSTVGGSGSQIANFVNNLRPRFEEVNFIIPAQCMSAGTLFALSGDAIVMPDRAVLGPIDPQIPAGNRYVPAQSLLLLIEQLQRDGQEALVKTGAVPWTMVQILNGINKNEIGAAISATDYATTVATEFLTKYKFKNWTIRRSSKQPVSPEYRATRAKTIANALADHSRWKDHGHGISRDVLWNEIQLEIEKPTMELDLAIRRAWALMTWIFDKTDVVKCICSSSGYRFIRSAVTDGGIK